MSATARLIAVAVLALVLAGAACAHDDATPAAPAAGIRAPATATAGSPIAVVVTTDRSGPLTLDVVDAFAVTTLAGMAENGDARFVIDGALTQLTGTLTFHAARHDGSEISATTTITPNPDPAPIDLTVGPRTIVADGADQTMAVAVVADPFGNAVVDGTAVSFTIDDNDGSSATHTTAVDHGVASVLIASDTFAGRAEVFASSPATRHDGSSPATAHSQRVPYHEVAGAPIGAELFIHSPVSGTLRADGRMLVELQAGPITDRHGNLLPDGHAVRLEFKTAAGSGQLTSTTIDGIARFTLRAPDRPGAVELRVVGDDDSDPLVLDFAGAVSELPLRLTSQGGLTTLDIGPVLDERGAIVADGTAAHVTGIDTDGTPGTTSVELRNGVARLTGDRIDTRAVTVTVLGTTVEETS